MSVKINVYNEKAEVVGSLDLSPKVFGVKANNELLHQAVVTQMANERQVLAHTKTRAEVRGGGKKPWKQKGTGRARVGSSRSPLWIGGGITFGPRKDRNFSKKMNQKMKQKAIFMALSDKAANNGLIILDNLEAKEFKTKKMADLISNFEKKVIKDKKRSVLVLDGSKDQKVRNSFRNLKNVEIINQENINILDLLKYRNLITTSQVIKNLEERYNK